LLVEIGREKLTTEAPVNGGRNYEKLVVVKFGYMLENLSIRRYSLVISGSNNPFGAGNQQERLISNAKSKRDS